MGGLLASAYATCLRYINLLHQGQRSVCPPSPMSFWDSHSTDKFNCSVTIFSKYKRRNSPSLSNFSIDDCIDSRDENSPLGSGFSTGTEDDAIH